MRRDRCPPLPADRTPYQRIGALVIANGILLRSVGGGEYQPLREAMLVDFRRYPVVVPTQSQVETGLNRKRGRKIIHASADYLTERMLRPQ
jgi:hypothetical protein